MVVKTFIVNTADNRTLAEALGVPQLLSYAIISYVWTVSVLGIAGNILAIIVFFRMLQNRSSGLESGDASKPLYLLLINLSVSDIIIILTNFVVSGISWIYGKWCFGRVGCVISTFFTFGFAATEWFTITAMVLYKLHRLLYPFSSFFSVRRMKFIIVFLWVSTLMSPLMWPEPYNIKFSDSLGNCFYENIVNEHSFHQIFSAVLTILNLVLLITGNCAIVWIVKFRSRAGSAGKAIRLILWISSTFILSNILVIYMTVRTLNGTRVSTLYTLLIWSYLLFQFNTFINPLMYAAIQKSFKVYLARLFHRDNLTTERFTTS